MASFDVWNPIMNFVTILLLTFSLFLVITGAFTAYFGSGKSRKIGVGYGMVVASAHRTPDLLRDMIRNTTARVFIGVAGLSAALPGTIAAHTTKPVIGVPVSGKLNLDAVLSVSQMPPGVPVAAVGLDRGEN